MERNSLPWRREASWRSTDTNAGCEANLNSVDEDDVDVDQYGEDDNSKVGDLLKQVLDPAG